MTQHKKRKAGVTQVTGWEHAPEIAALVHKAEKRKARTRGKPTEATVVKAITAWLKAAGIRHWRNNTQGNIKWLPTGAVLTPTSRVGSPDLEGQLPDGRYFCIEVKAPTWRAPSEPKVAYTATSSTWKTYQRHLRQETWLKDTVRLGGVAFFATSVDHVIDALGEYDARIPTHAPPEDTVPRRSHPACVSRYVRKSAQQGVRLDRARTGR